MPTDILDSLRKNAGEARGLLGQSPFVSSVPPSRSTPLKVAPRGQTDLGLPSIGAASDATNYSINMDRGADIDVRAGINLKVTPEGKRNYLEHYFGADNVGEDNGEFYIRDTEANEWYPVNRPGLDWGDPFSFGGDALRVLPEIAAKRPAGAGAGAGAGSILGQLVSGLVPGSDEMSEQDRMDDTALSAALGAATQWGANTLLSGADFLRPHNLASRYASPRMNTPEGKVGEQLGEDLGVNLTPAQVGMSKGLRQIESVALQHPITSDKTNAFFDQQRQTIMSRLNGLLERWSPGGAGAINTGAKVKETFTSGLEQMISRRRDVAKTDFAFLDDAAGNQPIFNVPSTLSVLDDYIERYSTPGSGGAAEVLVRELRKIRGDLVDPTTGLVKPVSGNDMQNLLHNWGAAAEGSRKPFLDLDTASQRRIAGEVFGSLKADLDAAAQNPPSWMGAAEAEALRKARANYYTNSQPINELRQSALGGIFKVDPETLTPEVIVNSLRRMNGTEFERTFDLLTAADPGAARMAQRQMIEEALFASRRRGVVRDLDSSDAPGLPAADQLNPSALVENLQKSNVWRTLGTDRMEMMLVLKGLERNAFMVGSGSQTTPLVWAMNLAKSAMGALGTLSPTQAAEVIAGVLVPSKIADAMLTHEGRVALNTLYSTNPPTRAIAGAVAYLSTLPTFQDIVHPSSEAAVNPSLDAAMHPATTQPGTGGGLVDILEQMEKTP